MTIVRRDGPRVATRREVRTKAIAEDKIAAVLAKAGIRVPTRAVDKPPMPRTAQPRVSTTAERRVQNKPPTRKHKTHLNPQEVSKLLMVSPVTVRQWAANGRLRSVTTPGGHRRFLLSDVEAFAGNRGATLAVSPESEPSYPQDLMRLLRCTLAATEALVAALRQIKW